MYIDVHDIVGFGDQSANTQKVVTPNMATEANI